MSPRLPGVLAGIGITVASLFLLPHRAMSETPPSASPAPATAVMASSTSCDGLRDVMVDTVVHQMVAGRGGYPYPYRQVVSRGRGGRPMPASRGAAPESTAATNESGGRGGGRYEDVADAPSHHTTTNVQERGVDEADIVKTDGRFVYTLHANELVIAKTWPVDKTDVAARVTFKTIQPQELYLRGNEVVVQGYAIKPLDGWNQGRTRVMTIDVTDRTAPKLRRILDVEGRASSSRLVGDDLYLVHNTAVQVPPRLIELAQKTIANIPRADQQSLRPWEVQSRLAQTLRQVLISNVTRADLDGALPRVRSGGTTTQMACADLYIPPNNVQLGVTSLARVSLSDRARIDLVGAMVSGGQVYASTAALYVAAPHYSWTATGGAEYVTQVHKFLLGDERSRPSYAASGMVEGQLLNQFSMSEHNGDLRIATTDWNWQGQQGGNHLFVMRAKGTTLATIGSIKGLAKGERIYSGRMVGDKGYLVTFRQTDPLFTLDLSDPFKPRVVGELKINGFSSYIHPMGDDLLLTIGQDANDQGRVTGVHLQVFDVSNPARPTRKFHEKMATPYSWSTAQNDHHAFMFDPVTRTLAFPLVEQGDGSWFNGLAVYTIDPRKGFKRMGKLDHGALADVAFEQACENLRTQNPQHAHHYCSGDHRRQARAQYPVTRSMVVDKYILSLSPIGLEIHELGDLDVAATLSWAKVQKKTATPQ